MYFCVHECINDGTRRVGAEFLSRQAETSPTVDALASPNWAMRGRRSFLEDETAMAQSLQRTEPIGGRSCIRLIVGAFL